MKIVHLLPGLTKGGGERVAADLANHAAQAGHEVTILVGFAADPSLLADRLRPEIEVRLITPPAAGRLSRYPQGMAWVRRNWKWLESRDVVHCHLTYGAAIGTFIRFLRGIKKASRPAVVETYHGVGMPVPRAHRWASAKMAARRDGLALMARDPYWDRFQARHPALLTELILNGVSAPRAVPESERDAYRRAVGLPQAARVVGTVGALRADRRTEAFVPAFAEIARRLGSEVHFLIGGDGPARGRVEEAVSAAGLTDRVHMAGLVRDPAEALAQLDLYVTLNVGSTTGVAALEAAMAGVPVLALQLREDYVASADDWIWSSPDPMELGERAAALLGDPLALRALAETQHAYANAHHGVEIMANAYQGFYEAAIARRRARPSQS